jgi:hypothetical protein
MAPLYNYPAQSSIFLYHFASFQTGYATALLFQLPSSIYYFMFLSPPFSTSTQVYPQSQRHHKSWRPSSPSRRAELPVLHFIVFPQSPQATQVTQLHCYFPSDILPMTYEKNPFSSLRRTPRITPRYAFPSDSPTFPALELQKSYSIPCPTPGSLDHARTRCQFHFFVSVTVQPLLPSKF